MKQLITSLVFCLALCASAQMPTFKSFNPADFDTNNYKISLKPGAVTPGTTNFVYGVVTNYVLAASNNITADMTNLVAGTSTSISNYVAAVSTSLSNYVGSVSTSLSNYVSVAVTGLSNYVAGVSNALYAGIYQLELTPPGMTGLTLATNGQTRLLGLNAALSALATNDGSGLTMKLLTNTIGITIDGGGAEIATGLKGYIEAPYACTIIGWTLVADQAGSIVIDVWNEPDPYDGSGVLDNPPTAAETITASAKPTLSSQQGKTSSTLTGWTTAIGNASLFAWNVDSASTITRATLTLKLVHAQ